jgi:hypothetical protein
MDDPKSFYAEKRGRLVEAQDALETLVANLGWTAKTIEGWDRILLHRFPFAFDIRWNIWRLREDANLGRGWCSSR